jgi:hypothetical protein
MPQSTQRRPRATCPALAAIVLVLGAPALRAQEPAGHPAASAAHDPEPHVESHEHANELAVFLGGTREEDETHLTLGAEYERRLGARFGLSVVAEHVDGVDAWVLLAPVTWRPIRERGLKLYAGPGFESRSEPKHPPEAATHASEETAEGGGRESFFVLRAGVGWAVELGRLALTPQVEVDFVREHGAWQGAFVFGIAVGFGF